MESSPWPIVRFGDVVREIRETEQNPLENGIERYVGLEHLDPESLRIRRWGEIADSDITFTRKFRAGQLLFGRRRAYQRKVAVADFDGICSGDIIVMEAKEEHLLPDLLPFIVQSEGFYEYALMTSAGSLSPRTKWAHLARYEFALPPREEQRRIAEILWAAEEVLESAEQVAAKAHRALVRACQEWTRNPSKIADQHWRKARIAECADNLDSRRIPLRESTRAEMQGEIPYYGANGPIDYINDYVYDEEIVLIGEDGDHFLKYNEWEQAHLANTRCWVNNHAHVLRAKPEFCSNEWLYRYFQHRNILSFLQDSASMTRRKLTQSTLLAVPVYMPRDLREQEQILSGASGKFMQL